MKSRIAVFCLFVAVQLLAVTKPVVFIDTFKLHKSSKATQEDAQILKERILGNIQNSNKYEVVERDRFETLTKEFELIDAGMTSGEDEPESNMLQAAGFAVYGSILQTRISSRKVRNVTNTVGLVEVQLRLSSIESGKIIAVKTVKGESSVGQMNAGSATFRAEALADAIEDVAKQVVNALLEISHPIKVVGVNKRYVTVALSEEQTSEGEIFEVYELGEALVDPDTGEELGYDEFLVGEVKVERPGPKLTRCVPCDDLETSEFEKGMVLRRVSKKKIEKKKRSAGNALRSMR